METVRPMQWARRLVVRIASKNVMPILAADLLTRCLPLDRIGRRLRDARPSVVGEYQPHADNAAKAREASARDGLSRIAANHRG